MGWRPRQHQSGNDRSLRIVPCSHCRPVAPITFIAGNWSNSQISLKMVEIYLNVPGSKDNRYGSQTTTRQSPTEERVGDTL